MATPLSVARLNEVFHLELPEDRTVRKIFSAFPFLGTFVLNEQIKSLKQRIANTDNSYYKIELIDIKNEYHTIGCIRNLYEIALLISSVALGVIGFEFGIGFIFIKVIRLSTRLDSIYHNESEIRRHHLLMSVRR